MTKTDDGLSIFQQPVNPPLVFLAGGEWVVRLRLDPPSVELRDGVSLDDAAKAFWNAVCLVRGLAPLFPPPGDAP